MGLPERYAGLLLAIPPHLCLPFAVMQIKRRISRMFYQHGLLCARFPVYILVSVILIILFFWYPLLLLSIPTRTPYEFVRSDVGAGVDGESAASLASGRQSSSHRWLHHHQPESVILQLRVTAHVPRRRAAEAVRAALAGSFELHALVRDFRHGNASLGDLCTVVDEAAGLSAFERRHLPEFGCLLLSPALLWGLQVEEFNGDRDPTKTIYTSPLKEVLFGMPWRHTGVSWFNMRSRDRVISYCVTAFMRIVDWGFVQALTERATKLSWVQPASVVKGNVSLLTVLTVTHIYFKDNSFIVEYTPLLVLYTILFLYIYFSVRKIRMVKSKWGLAFGACFTVVASLLMSVGVCMYFGMTPSLNGSETFPYLVVLIGMENVLVITKSVVSTPVELDVRHRVALGLSKEGWAITRSLVAEVGLLSLGLLSFNTSIQEFALFAVVGLCTDFFLQMFFFVTILAIDIKRMEAPGAQHQQRQEQQLLQVQHLHEPSLSNVREVPEDLAVTLGCDGDEADTEAAAAASAAVEEQFRQLQQFHQHHRRQPSDANTAAFLMHSGGRGNVGSAVPRRIRVFYFLANKRLALRLLLLLLMLWLLQASGLLAAAGRLLHQSLPATDSAASAPDLPDHYWSEMAQLHWPALYSHYNRSLTGRYVTYLGTPPLYYSAPATGSSVIDDASAAAAAAAGTSSIESVDGNGGDLWPPAQWWPLGRPASFHGTWGLALVCMLGVTFVLTSTYALMLCCQLCGLAWVFRVGHMARRQPKERTVVPAVLPAHAMDVDLTCTECSSASAALAVSPPRLLVAASLDGSVSVWNVDGRQIAYLDRELALSTATPAAESDGIGCGSGDGGANDTGTTTSAGGLRQRVAPAVATTGVLNSLPSATATTAAVSKTSNTTVNTPTVWCLALAEEGRSLLVGCSDGCLELWSIGASKPGSHELRCRLRLADDEGLAHLVVQGQLAVAATVSGVLHSVQLAPAFGGGLRSLASHRASPLPLRRMLVWRGDLLVTGGEDHLIRFFPISDISLGGSSVSAHSGPVLALAAFPSRGVFSGGADGAVFQVSPNESASGFRQKRLVWQRQPVLSLSVSERYAVCGLADGQLLLLRLCTGAWRLLAQQSRQQSPEDSPDLCYGGGAPPLLCAWSPPCLLSSADALVTASPREGSLDVWCLASRRRMSHARLVTNRGSAKGLTALRGPVQPVCVMAGGMLVCKCGPNLLLVPECQLT